MDRTKTNPHAAGSALYVIAALALSLVAWHTGKSLSDAIPKTLRLLTIGISILLSLLVVLIQYKKVFGKAGRMARQNRLRIRKEETKEELMRRRAAIALWALCRSFILLILWALLCWGAVSLLNLWLAAISGQNAQFIMLFVAYGAALSLWAVADQFIP